MFATFRPSLPLVLLCALIFAGCAAPPAASPVGPAVSFLAQTQNEDGGFSAAPGGPSDVSTSAWALLALVSGGGPADSIASARGFLESQQDAVVQGTTGSFSRANAISLYLLALRSAGAPAGPELEANLSSAAEGPLSLNEEIFALGTLGRLGLVASAQPLAERTAARLRGQNASEVSTDAWFRSHAIQALLAAGRAPYEPELRDAARSLRPFQQGEGGYRSTMDADPDASTTAAVAVVFHRISFVYSPELATATAYLRSLQDRDGSVRFSETVDFARTKTTAEAVLAWTGHGPFGVPAPSA